MFSCWDEPPEFETTSTKRGLKPEKFESILRFKISNIFEDQGEALNPSVLIHIGKLKEEVCLQENGTSANSDQGDRVARDNYVKHGFLPDPCETPMRMKESTGGHRGVIRYDRQQILLYHSRQYDLFFKNELLGIVFHNLFPHVVLNENPKLKGFFFKGDGAIYTTEEACAVIDRITSEYTRFFRDDRVPPDEWGLQNIEEIRLHCVLILMGRMIVGWVTENNLQTTSGKQNWKNHVEIVISYAALVVILDLTLERMNFLRAAL